MPIQTNRVTASIKSNPNVRTSTTTREHLGASAVNSTTNVEARFLGILGETGNTGLTGDTGGQGIQGIQGDIGIIWMGAYDPNAIYQSRNVVSYYGSSYIFIGASPEIGKLPTDLTYWEVMVAKGEQGNTGSGTDQYASLTKDPTGFQNNLDSVFIIDNINNNFTIQPTVSGGSYTVLVSGNIFTKTIPDTINFGTTEGLVYFYFDHNGIIQLTRIFPNLENIALIAVIYWSVDKNTSIWTGDERHGLSMDWATQEYLHHTRGCVYASGLDLSYDDNSDGTTDDELKISLSDGIIYDESLKFNITNVTQVLSPDLKAPLFYKKTNGDWDFFNATPYPVHFGTSRIQYNRFNGTWTLDDIINERYGCIWLFATHNIDSPIIGVMGQNIGTTIEDCENKNTYASLNQDGLPYRDIKSLYRLIYKVDDSYSNSLKCKLVSISDFRGLNDNKNVNELGGKDKHFHHQQHNADTTWIVNHNLDKFPSVTIIDSGGNEVEGCINYISINQVELTFTVPFTGDVYLN
jgi:hypothetical protein